jgi:hypothetical protein
LDEEHTQALRAMVQKYGERGTVNALADLLQEFAEKGATLPHDTTNPHFAHLMLEPTDIEQAANTLDGDLF